MNVVYIPCIRRQGSSVLGLGFKVQGSCEELRLLDRRCSWVDYETSSGFWVSGMGVGSIREGEADLGASQPNQSYEA